MIDKQFLTYIICLTLCFILGYMCGRLKTLQIHIKEFIEHKYPVKLKSVD